MKFNFKKRFGQNFLVNPYIINKIVESMNHFNDIIEIGPGNGALTKELLLKGKKVTAIDIDLDCIVELSKINDVNLNLVHADVLKYDIPNKPIIGNLPYNISSKIIEKLVFKTVPYAVFMVQKEVGDILTSKDFSKLTVFVHAKYDIIKLIDVAAGNFFPKPKVKSQVVIFKKHNLYEDLDIIKLKEILFKLFFYRRKKLTFIKKIDEILYNKIILANWNLNCRIENIEKEKIYELMKMLK